MKKLYELMNKPYGYLTLNFVVMFAFCLLIDLAEFIIEGHLPLQNILFSLGLSTVMSIAFTLFNKGGLR